MNKHHAQVEIMSPLALLHEQLALERVGVSEAGRLYRLPGDNPDSIARVLAARLATGEFVAYLRDDVDGPVVGRLAAMMPHQLFAEVERVTDILAEVRGERQLVGRFRTFRFVRPPETSECGAARLHQGRFVAWRAGDIAAEAWSSRETERAAELAVETQPAFRRRGFGRQVCAAWARHQLTAGRIAFYSHHVDNAASAALARSLGVEHCLDVVAYE